jgi:hypothetical protein
MRAQLSLVIGLVLLSTAALAEKDQIYKCTSSTGAVSYSKTPCAKNTSGVPVAVRKPPKESADAQNTPAPSTPVSEAKQVEEQVKSSIPRRTPFPPVLHERCRNESFSIKRDLDQRFAALKNAMTQARLDMAQNDRDLREAETSKVGIEWSRQLQAQRSEIDARIKGTDESFAAFYAEEKGLLDGLAKRCKK